MNSIELDINKSTIFIPKETAEAIGYAKEMSILYRIRGFFIPCLGSPRIHY